MVEGEKAWISSKRRDLCLVEKSNSSVMVHLVGEAHIWRSQPGYYLGVYCTFHAYESISSYPSMDGAEDSKR